MKSTRGDWLKGISRHLWNEHALGVALLLVVIVAIVAPWQGDIRRMFDLMRVKHALEQYAASNGGSYLLPAGYAGVGQGWINYRYENHPTIVEALHARGFLSSANIDDQVQRPGFLLFLCNDNKRYTLYATFNGPAPYGSLIASDGCSGRGTNGAVDIYRKNFAVGN